MMNLMTISFSLLLTRYLQKAVMQFKIGTGVGMTAIPPKKFSELKGITLTQAHKVLHGPAKHPLKVSGQFIGKLSYKQFTTHSKVFVVDWLQQPLIGHPAIKVPYSGNDCGGVNVWQLPN